MAELEETLRLMDFLPTATVSDYNINKKVDADINNFLKVNNDEASDDDNNDVNSMLFYEGPFTRTDFYSEFVYNLLHLIYIVNASHIYMYVYNFRYLYIAPVG